MSTSFFYGGVQGNRGEATRGGTKAGLSAYAKSWVTTVDVHYGFNEEAQGTKIKVSARGLNSRREITLFDGTEEELLVLLRGPPIELRPMVKGRPRVVA